MKARRVKGLDPDGTLADELERIVRVRLEEVRSFMPRAADPAEVEALHDLRIAAKRLRYVLEIAEGCFGPYAERAVKEVKGLQDLVGEIHDCDVTLPGVLARIDQARREDVAALVAGAHGAEDLEPGAVASAPNAAAYRGLHALATHLQARRQVLFGVFLERWTQLERDGFAPRLRYAIGERPGTGSHDLNGAPQAQDLPSPAP